MKQRNTDIKNQNIKVIKVSDKFLGLLKKYDYVSKCKFTLSFSLLTSNSLQVREVSIVLFLLSRKFIPRINMKRKRFKRQKFQWKMIMKFKIYLSNQLHNHNLFKEIKYQIDPFKLRMNSLSLKISQRLHSQPRKGTI